MREKSKEDTFPLPLPVLPNPSLTSGEETELLTAGSVRRKTPGEPSQQTRCEGNIY